VGTRRTESRAAHFQAFGRFGETLVPILRDMGVEGDPEVYPAHTFVSA
jgi:hypothetical protein